MNYEPWLLAELGAVQLLLDRVPAFLAEAMGVAPETDNGPYAVPILQTTREAYRRASTLALEGVVHHLNSLVDASILALTNRLSESEPLPENLTKSRRTLLTALERALDTKAGLHPGWDQVELLREDGNAIKHRGGVLGFRPHASGVLWIDTVTLTSSLLTQRMDGVRRWLSSLSALVRQRTTPTPAA